MALIIPIGVAISASGVRASAPSSGTDSHPGEGITMAIQANNTFALDLYRHLAADDPGGNLFVSPWSILNALAMTAEGARGETAGEMGRALRLPAALHRGDAAVPWDLAPLHVGIAEENGRLGRGELPGDSPLRARVAELRDQLDAANRRAEESSAQRKWDEAEAEGGRAEQLAAELNDLLPRVDQYTIRVANALWGERSAPFRREFVDVLAQTYETGGLFPVDFRNDPEAARKRINAWVEEQTDDRIRDLIGEGMLTPLTRLVLTNAIYFKGEWSEPFKEANTKPAAFTRADCSTVDVPLMEARAMETARYAAFNVDGSFFETPHEVPLDDTGDDPSRYPAEDGFTMIELPYKGARLAMVLVAPNRPDGLPAVEARLTAEGLSAWIDRLARRDVHVLVPRFKLEAGYELSESLKKLGMERAFRNPLDGNGAEFQGMTTTEDPAEQLFIGAVLHKAFVEVNEKGTEAAAATAVMMRAGAAAPIMIPFVPHFHADRPFLFLIRDIETGAILFLGRMESPA